MEQEQTKAKKRDSLLNVIFALTIENDDEEEQYLMLDEIKEIIDRIKQVSEQYPYIYDYDMPDLNPSSLKRNKYIDFVSLDQKVGFHMGLEDAKKIIKRNKDIIHIIENFSIVEKFNYAVMQLTNDQVVFDCHNPNGKYGIGYYDNGEEHDENKLFTDGNVTVLEKTDTYKLVEVDGATYTIQGAYDENGLRAGVVKSCYIAPGYLNFLLYEVRDFYNGMHGTYEESEKPSVLRKRLN